MVTRCAASDEKQNVLSDEAELTGRADISSVLSRASGLKFASDEVDFSGMGVAG